MVYEINSEQYKGPLEKLLELIEEKKMEIAIISMAKVTADFLIYLEKITDTQDSEEGRRFLADFLVIASKLLLIKSKTLLPSLAISGDEELEIRDLETRLKIYQEIRKTVPHLKEGWDVLPRILSREFLKTQEAVFYPPKGVTPEILRDSFANMAGELEKILKPKAVIKKEIINLKAKIEEIITRLTDKPICFKDLTCENSRSELVVLFLAILHLIKEQIVNVEQSGHFSEMNITKKEALAT